jgi:hypothetical protein
MLARAHNIAALLWAAVATGAGLGFVARDLLGLPRPLVALAWTAGALGPLAPLIRGARRRRALDPER